MSGADDGREETLSEFQVFGEAWRDFLLGVAYAWKVDKACDFLASRIHSAKERVEGLRGREEETMSTLRSLGGHCIDDFEWKADPDDEFAKVQEVLEYLVQWGRALYPCWHWEVMPIDLIAWERDMCCLKIMQWRGWGFSRESYRFENGEKHGVILGMLKEGLLWLWHEPLERKAKYAERIVCDTVGHTQVIDARGYYQWFTPTLVLTSEEVM